jgi:hypothetical protein
LAIERYQRSRGFEPTGYLTRPVVSRILQETEGVSQGVIIGTEILRSILGGN